jgi:hypothetical protein
VTVHLTLREQNLNLYSYLADLVWFDLPRLQVEAELNYLTEIDGSRRSTSHERLSHAPQTLVPEASHSRD